MNKIKIKKPYFLTGEISRDLLMDEAIAASADRLRPLRAAPLPFQPYA
ncbi:MAG: hypothetical protein WCP70_07490 [Methanothrix sp.]